MPSKKAASKRTTGKRPAAKKSAAKKSGTKRGAALSGAPRARSGRVNGEGQGPGARVGIGPRWPSRDVEPEEWPTITLRLGSGGEAITLKSAPRLQRAALRWSYVLLNRRRWVSQPASRDEQAKLSVEEFGYLGVGAEELGRIAGADVVEVSIPYTEEHWGWEARVFPWEYMLNAATRSVRQGRPLTIIRHLDRRGAALNARTPSRLLFVESSPTELKDVYDFSAERSLVVNKLSMREHKVSEDEAPEELRKTVRVFAPDVIHLAGVDNHQAVGLIKSLRAAENTPDGYLMRGARGAAEMVEAERLAGIVNAAERKPSLVSYNLYNSAARVCPLTVAGGAGAALGFQDEIDDIIAEFFFTNFYHAWHLSGWDLLEAFSLACEMLRSQPYDLHGTGITLWSERPLLPAEAPARRKGARRAPSVPVTKESLAQKMREEKGRDLTPESIKGRPASDVFNVVVKPYETINYSMLHNNRPIFETFSIKNQETGQVKDIRVEVTLFTGAGTSFPYSYKFDMKESSIDLRDQIRVPLIYSLGMQFNESVHTGLFVKVTWQGQEIYANTHRVTLLPLDTWRDDDTDRGWLPSFVLPRDRAVNRVVDAAQRYLMALADDSGVGFDGYQSVFEEPDKTTPGGLRLNTDGVDTQVQALWAALAYDMNLSYINPPPTYNAASQRLRTPSDVIEGRRGTCVDLALLVATCLEYVEIYPVIILLEGHAFPGYWRSEAYHEEFKKVKDTLPVLLPGERTGDPGAQTTGAITGPQGWPWYLGKDAYDEVVQQVRDGKLVPLESTLLTRRGSFGEAVEEGVKNFRNKREFHSLTDIYLARTPPNLVTPIPFGGRVE